MSWLRPSVLLLSAARLEPGKRTETRLKISSKVLHCTGVMMWKWHCGQTYRLILYPVVVHAERGWVVEQVEGGQLAAQQKLWFLHLFLEQLGPPHLTRWPLRCCQTPAQLHWQPGLLAESPGSPWMVLKSGWGNALWGPAWTRTATNTHRQSDAQKVEVTVWKTMWKIQHTEIHNQ